MKMFRSNLVTQPYISHGPSYGQNVARATRGLLAALLAAEPEDLENGFPCNEVSESERSNDIDELNALASHFDAIMPNQAAELRYLAGSDSYIDDDEEL
jgi:hypothetical protein